jgi:DNA adenine methylase
MSEAKITALAPWFGAKRTLAPEIVAEFGDHRVYWEPFCGSMAVLLAKPVCVMETANDLHGDLINLARVLKDEKTAIDLYSRVERLIFHEGLFHEAADRCRERELDPAGESPDVGRAEDFMVVSWFGRNGTIGTGSYNHNFCVRYTANGGHAARRWLSVTESLPWWHRRLRHVTLLDRDAFEILGRVADDGDTVIYADPPYMIKGAKYFYDFEAADHIRLAESLSRFKRARVVVSYYEHERLADLYPGWRKRSFEVSKSLVNQGKRDQAGATKATEVLLINDGLMF